jgi:hypothetical protein
VLAADLRQRLLMLPESGEQTGRFSKGQSHYAGVAAIKPGDEAGSLVLYTIGTGLVQRPVDFTVSATLFKTEWSEPHATGIDQ